MLQRPLSRGGRTQNYHVSPVRYTLSGGGDDPEVWGARLAGFLHVVAGVLLLAVLVLPALGSAGAVITVLFAPLWGLLGLVTIIPTRTEPWVWLLLAAAFFTVGVGILRGWRIAHFAGIGVAIVLFVPAFWAGSLVGVALLVALWRGQKALAKASATPAGADDST